VPTRIPGIPASHYDMSFRPWSSGSGEAPALDAVEALNLPLAIGNVLSAPGGRTAEERALVEADRLARSERRRVALVGGTDNHARMLVATTWVRAAEHTPEAILAALRAGAVCYGGPDAGDLELAGDDGTWAGVGGAVRARAQVKLRWHGKGELWVDGESRGVLEGGATVTVDGAPHTFRLVKGRSRSGFAYANL
jgi:hypothetical protein